MSIEYLLFTLAILVGFYTAWNIGANDVSNAMGTSVGSKALSLRQAVILAALFEFCGAFFFGSSVSKTLQTGIVHSYYFMDEPRVLATGMLASLLATGMWLQIASYCGWPVSTTHSIVGAIVGFGCISKGIEAVQWDQIIRIGMSWVISPICGALVSYALFSLIRKKILFSEHPLESTRKMIPWILFCFIFTLFLSLFYDKNQSEATYLKLFCGASTVAAIAGSIVKWILNQYSGYSTTETKNVPLDNKQLKDLTSARLHLTRLRENSTGEMYYQITTLLEELEGLHYSLQQNFHNKKGHSEFHKVEYLFGWLQVSTACLMAFSHGANDVSNAIGPLSSIIYAIQGNNLSPEGAIDSWILALGGIGIVIGLATWGWRVIETIGKKITELTPTRGFVAEAGASLTVLIASRIGLPISTTHTLVGAVLGVGLAGGIGSINLITIRDILLSWIITIPAGATLSIICFYLLNLFI